MLEDMHSPDTDKTAMGRDTVMSQQSFVVPASVTDQRRRARFVLWAAGVIAFLGLVGGGIASSHLTSSLSDYDAPGISRRAGPAPTAAGDGRQSRRGIRGGRAHSGTHHGASPLPARVASVVALLRARPEVRNVLDYANTGDRSMISGTEHSPSWWPPSAP